MVCRDVGLDAGWERRAGQSEGVSDPGPHRRSALLIRVLGTFLKKVYAAFPEHIYFYFTTITFVKFYYHNEPGLLKTVKIQNKYVPSKNKLEHETTVKFTYVLE